MTNWKILKSQKKNLNLTKLRKFFVENIFLQSKKSTKREFQKSQKKNLNLSFLPKIYSPYQKNLRNGIPKFTKRLRVFSWIFSYVRDLGSSKRETTENTRFSQHIYFWQKCSNLSCKFFSFFFNKFVSWSFYRSHHIFCCARSLVLFFVHFFFSPLIFQ